MLRSNLDRWFLVLFLAAICSACSAEPDEKPTPHRLPLFDGQPRSHLITSQPLQIDPGPDAEELFTRVMQCYPSPSFFRAELHAEARSGRVVQSDGSLSSGPGASLILRVPLWSALELDRERERESSRRQKAAGSVGIYIGALVEWRLAGRELELLRSIERRAQERVALGVAETAEQVKAVERVAALERERVQHLAKITQARLEMLGLCSSDKAEGLQTYMKRFTPIDGARP